MSENHEPPPELLQGYSLLDRLGAGGYGEVWRARAPGGLIKAVKYVFGRQDEARASAELKSLERIKGVRHPFLLSLERIEIVDGRLVVVTELADGSLRDRYAACLEEGQPGIPRDELLGYVRDAADALDCLNREHGLQHLDIKPENLLLVAGHVKVADFGLVKNVSANTQSLVGGMTPVYAAPEVFQGKPSEHSDQYSLAILYQELLTGTLPFAGANAAELTLQHLHEEPQLEALDERERYVISRALAKDPQYRFDSCSDMARQLVAALSETAEAAPISAPRTRRPMRPQSASAVSSSATEVFEAEENPGWSAPDSPILIDLPPQPEPAVELLPAPEVDAEGFEPSPALYIGIGAAGAKTLRGLRQRLTERYGPDGAPPTLAMLLLDTDAKVLTAATRGSERGEGLTRAETIALPLRRPQEYREKSSNLLTWLGRRWLYNIPKTLQTDGIRPLGRLALVDHARQAFQRIRRAMADCVSEESLLAASEECSQPFTKGKLRVYVCTSISGGAGGGMAIDVAYAVRSIMSRLAVDDARLIGVMAHATGRDSRRGELARVNAFSWLSEYHHLSKAAIAYPGDESCGLPAHEPGVTAFDETYLVDMGAGLDAVAFEAGARSLADYLYLDSVTPTQRLLDQCRAEPLPTDRSGRLRSFSIRRCESAPASTRGLAERMAIDQVVSSWVGQSSAAQAPQAEEGDTSTASLVHGAPQIVGQLKLESAGLASLCRTLIEAQLEHAGVAPDQHCQAGAQWFATAADADDGEQIGPPAVVAGVPLAELVSPLAETLSQRLTQWLLGRIDIPRERVAGARRAAAWFRDHLRSVQSDLARLVESAAAQAGEWTTSTDPDAKAFRQLIDYAAVSSATTLVGELFDAITAAEQQTDAAAEALQTLRPQGSIDEPDTEHPDLPIVREHLQPILSEMRERAQGELLQPGGGLLTITLSEPRLQRLDEGLGRLAEQVVARRFSGAPTGPEADSEEADGGCPLPALGETGAVARRFVVRPPTDNTASNPFAVEGWTEADADDTAAYWLVEAAGLSLPRVAAEVVGRRLDYAKLAERVHTRRDIEWSDLLDELKPQPGEAAGANSTSAPVVANTDTPCPQTLQEPAGVGVVEHASEPTFTEPCNA